MDHWTGKVADNMIEIIIILNYFWSRKRVNQLNQTWIDQTNEAQATIFYIALNIEFG